MTKEKLPLSMSSSLRKVKKARRSREHNMPRLNEVPQDMTGGDYIDFQAATVDAKKRTISTFTISVLVEEEYILF